MSALLDLPTYSYSPLDHSVQETRLAELLPGKYENELHLRIHTVALSSARGSLPEQHGFTVEDLQKDLPDEWKVRETLNGRFIFERKRKYGPQEPYETQWVHPTARFEPVANNHNLIYTKPEYEALSHVWGPEGDETPVYIHTTSITAPRQDSDHAVNEQVKDARQNTGRKRTAVDDTPSPDTKRVKTMSRVKTWSGPSGSIGSGSSTVTLEEDTVQSILQIRSGLAVALRHLRHLNRSRFLWVDNICINQNDISERSHLVRHMGQIYRLAQKVIVWIGPEYDNSNLAMSRLEYLGRQVEITDKGSWRVNAPACLEPTWSRTATSLPYDDETWKAITGLIERPWFNRLWVWQEAKLSNDDSIIQCGQKKMELYRFGAAVWCASAKVVSNSLLSSLYQAGNAVLRHFDEPFINTLLHLNAKQCYDPRDKIYGALGLAPPEVVDEIIPAYDREVEDVYSDAAVALFRATSRVDFLLACDLGSRILPGPSWAPDWSVTQRMSPRWLLSTTLASGVSISTAELVKSPKPTLRLQGVECGTICRVGERSPSTKDDPTRTREAIKSWIPEGLLEKTYVDSEEPFLDAFVKTIMWNTLRERCPLDHGLLTLAEARAALLRMVGLSDTAILDASPLSSSNYRSDSSSFREARGRSLIELDTGHIGMTSAAAEETDVICVILGCPLPMILRPHSSGRYHVVGPAYVYGLMDAEGVLGQLHPDYIVQTRVSLGWYGGFTFCNTRTGEVTEEDPRLGELPPSWVRTEATRMPTDPLHFVRFRHLATGESINGDPRLLPDALRARGVMLKPIHLV